MDATYRMIVIGAAVIALAIGFFLGHIWWP
jgi:hypothetical protein